MMEQEVRTNTGWAAILYIDSTVLLASDKRDREIKGKPVYEYTDTSQKLFLEVYSYNN